MGIKWDKIMEIEKRQFEKMNELDRFIYFLLLQFGSPYAWGKENPEGADCFGAICLALYAATGLLIRTTADGLLKQVLPKSTHGLTIFGRCFISPKRTRDTETVM